VMQLCYTRSLVTEMNDTEPHRGSLGLAAAQKHRFGWVSYRHGPRCSY